MARALLIPIFGIILSLVLSTGTFAQENTEIDRSATGGAQTLEDIMARQRGEKLDDSFRSGATGDPDAAAGITNQLGTLGGASDPELWRAYRYGTANITTQVRGPAAGVVIQDGGMWWYSFRNGPLATYGAYLLGGTILLLALFYVVRGRIRIDGEKTGRTITRFQAAERFGHWLMAGSFLVLGLTGLISLFGRKVMIPLFGHESFSTIAIASKWDGVFHVGGAQPARKIRSEMAGAGGRNFPQRPASACGKIQRRPKADILVGHCFGGVNFCVRSFVAVSV